MSIFVIWVLMIWKIPNYTTKIELQFFRELIICPEARQQRVEQSRKQKKK